MSRPSAPAPNSATTNNHHNSDDDNARTTTTTITTTIVTDSPGPCPLIDKLPNELRQQIYAYLSFGHLDYPGLVTRDTWIRAANPYATPTLHTPPLARTCRLLRTDVLRHYLGNLRVELSDSSELDGVFLERCLRALGSAVLHVRRLTVEHKVDVCLDEDQHDALRVRATTVFEVKESDPGPVAQSAAAPEGSCADRNDSPQQVAEPSVSISCDFNPLTRVGDEVLPEPGTVCTCSIGDRLAGHDYSSLRDHVHLHPRIPSSPLTRSVSRFLTQMDVESSNPNLETRPRWHPGGNMFSALGNSVIPWGAPANSSAPPHPLGAAILPQYWPWPVCATCRRKRWLLQGPIIRWNCDEGVLRESTGKGFPRRIQYAGYTWIACPDELPLPALKQNRKLAGNGFRTALRCRWGPKRPVLVRPYGQKSRRFL